MECSVNYGYWEITGRRAGVAYLKDYVDIYV
jgi:hypothetical protein